MATRPTGDRAKVALFNMLHEKLAGARVLDGFAGSGALSFESLSRGAASAVLFEKDGQAAALLRRNAEKLGLAQLVDIRYADFMGAAAGLKEKLFDIVFLDPQYAAGLHCGAIKVSERLLAPGGIIAAEHGAADELPDSIGGLVKSDCRRYGAAAFTFYQRQEHS
jgi:16S rRNA (guanine966-N2)-methyltransferase